MLYYLVKVRCDIIKQLQKNKKADGNRSDK